MLLEPAQPVALPCFKGLVVSNRSVLHASLVAPGGPAGAQETTAQARRLGAASHPTPFKANMVWAYDFVCDATASGQQIKCLTVIDEFVRECLTRELAWQPEPSQE